VRGAARSADGARGGGGGGGGFLEKKGGGGGGRLTLMVKFEVNVSARCNSNLILLAIRKIVADG